MRYGWPLLAVALAASGSLAAAFDDVDFEHWAYQAVEELAQAGVLEGFPGLDFEGETPVTRYQAARAFLRGYFWFAHADLFADPVARDFEPLVERWAREHAAELAGRPGAPGHDGAPGPDGAAGRPGKPGVDGRDGQDGQPGADADGAALQAAIDRLGQDYAAWTAQLRQIHAELTALQDDAAKVEP